MKRTLALTCAILALALLTGTATADMDYYVRYGGTGTGGLSWGDAFGTIQDAYDAVAALGSTNAAGINSIHIERTTGDQKYAGAIWTDTWYKTSKSYTMKHIGGYAVSAGGMGTASDVDMSKVEVNSGVALYADTSESYYNARSYTTFEFDGMHVVGQTGAVLMEAGWSDRIEGYRSIFEKKSTGTSDQAVLSIPSHTGYYSSGTKYNAVVLDRCLVTGGASGGIALDKGVGNNATVTLTNTAIVNTGTFGIRAIAVAQGASKDGVAVVDLENVTIFGVSDVAIRCGLADETGSYREENRLYMDGVLLCPNSEDAYLIRSDDNDYTNSKNGGMRVTGSNNAFYRYKENTDLTIPGSNKWTDPASNSLGGFNFSAFDTPILDYLAIGSDPGLKADGFHLLAGSDLIDAALAGLSVDYDNELRPDGTGAGTGYDIGADEYVPEPATMGLLGLGFAGMAVLRKRRRRA